MSFKEIRLEVTTDGSGDATTDATTAVMGRLYAIAWVDGDLVDNVTAVISTQGAEASQTLMSIGAGEGDNDAIFYPRHIVHDEGADVLTGTAGGDRTLPLMVGTPRLVVAAGGGTKTGACILYYEEWI